MVERKAADRSRQRQETCCMEMALERWGCRESECSLDKVEFVIGRLKGVEQRVGG